MLEPRTLWSAPPPAPRSRMENWPTVLFSWWATSFSAVIILIRLCGRKVRSNRLFREDYIMFMALVPLFIRMIFIHFVLIYGTNNVQTVGHVYTATQLYHRSIGARLVLVARIFYAMYIWLCKLTVSEFLKRITIRIWRRSYEWTLQGIRVFLLLTFIAVVISTLTECQPFDHYWQVIPDPGPHCRQGYGFLLTMSICDMVSDVLLIAFPIPVVLASGQTWKRKLQMGSLFSLSIIMIAVTATRVPQVIGRHGLQQYRTVWASCEILAATSVANAVILGSFLRDKGTKKNKYRSYSVSDSIERAPTRRPTLRSLDPYDSDEDLFRDLGYRMPEHLQDPREHSPRPAPPAPPASTEGRLPHKQRHATPMLEAKKVDRNSDSTVASSVGFLDHALPSPVSSTNRSINFFDVGNLITDGNDNHLSGPPRSRPNTTTGSGTTAHDFASLSDSHSPGTRSFLQDFGGILSPSRHNGHVVHPHASSPDPPNEARGRGRQGAPPTGVLAPQLIRHNTQTSLQDAGGLLQASSGPAAFTHRNSIGLAPDQLSALDEYHLRARAGLADENGIMPSSRHADANAGTLQIPSDRHSSPIPQRATAGRAPHEFELDEMVLHDPGGLTRG